jgi:hypothetical protein
MSNGTFVLALAVGAGLLAIWTYARFPGLAPEQLGRTILHTAGALLLLQLLPVVLGSGLNLYVALFGIALPALTYAMLAVLWTLKIAQSSLGFQR